MLNKVSALSFGSSILKKEFCYISIILIVLTLIFTSTVIFTGQYYNSNTYLYKFSPWNQYAPDKFGNYNLLSYDDALNEDPYRRTLNSHIRNGEFPLWNPNSYAGAPFIYSQILSPTLFLYYLLPMSLAFNIDFPLKLFVAGIGSYYFLRELKCNKTGSLFSAISFMFSGAMVLGGGNDGWTTVVMIFPYVFLFAHRLSYNPSWRNFVFMSLSVGVLMLGGHDETAVVFLYAVILYFIFQFLLRIRTSLKKNLKYAIAFFGSTGIGFGVSAIHIIPFLDYLTKSSIWIERSFKSQSSSLSLSNMITTLLPEFFGRPTYAFWGVSGFNNLNFNHVGMVAIFFAILCSLFLFRRNHEVKFFSIATILFLGFNYKIPIFSDIFRSLPFMNLVASGLNGLVLAFLLSILAGIGADLIINKRIGISKIIAASLLIAVAFCSISVFYTIASIENPPSLFLISTSPIDNAIQNTPPTIFYESMKLQLVIFLVLLILTVIGIILVSLDKISSKVFQLVIIFILSTSMFEFGMNYISSSTSSDAPTTPAIDFLKNDKSLHRVFPTGTTLEPDTNLNYDITSIRGKDNLRQPAFVDFFRSMGDVRTNIEFISTDYSSTLLNLLNVKYVLIPSNEKIVDDIRYKEVFHDNSLKVLENKDVLPRGFMVFNYSQIHPDDSYKDWINFQYVKGWIKGAKNESIQIMIYGPTSNDFRKYIVTTNTSEWEQFVVKLDRPDAVSGKPDLSKVMRIEILVPSYDNSFQIKELQLAKEFSEVSYNGLPFWSIEKFTGGELNCKIDQSDKLTHLTITPSGDGIECVLSHKFTQPADFSKYRMIELWNDGIGVYQFYVFGPTLNDFERFDVYQYSIGQLSKVNVNLNAPVEIQGNPDLSKVIQIRADPGGGRDLGNFRITDPILQISDPIEILYKSNHLDEENNGKTECNILSNSDLSRPLDTKFISKIPTHQPKDMFYFEKIEQKEGNNCKLVLSPKYSETLLLLRNPDFNYTENIIINEINLDKINLVGQGKSTVKSLEYANNYQKWEVNTTQPGFFFVSDLYWPDWHAFVDGKEVHIFRTDWAFRSIYVTEGNHLAEFKYEPLSFIIGLILTTLSLSFLAITTLVLVKRRNKMIKKDA